MGVYSVDSLISEARKLAAEFKRTTGKPLPGVSGEIAEHDAARLLNLELLQNKTGGYDAVGKGRREGKRVQIKGRVIFDENKTGQRVGQVKLEQEWDSILLLLMDDSYEAYEIYEAERDDIMGAMEEQGENARKKRGAMSVNRFKVISSLVWTREDGELDDEVWDNRQASD
ncbi:MAG: hypothetical protein V3V12_02870 [Gammaproteobacteria bacterium]